MSAGTKAAIARRDAHDKLDQLIVDNPNLGAAVDMRAQGFSLRQIAKALGWKNQSSPARLLERFDELTQLLDAADLTHEVRNSVRTVDIAMQSCWSIVSAHTRRSDDVFKDGRVFDQDGVEKRDEVRLRALGQIDRFVGRRADLLGLNAPEKLDVNHTATGIASWVRQVAEGKLGAPIGALGSIDDPDEVDQPAPPQH